MSLLDFWILMFEGVFQAYIYHRKSNRGGVLNEIWFRRSPSIFFAHCLGILSNQQEIDTYFLTIRERIDTVYRSLHFPEFVRKSTDFKSYLF